uniref:Haloacid dehalogenase-like hydrolase domain-containing protein 2 n=1 Tax=Clastoptera arizonana TaxID=38151 RepID=A0A1B6E3G9_9HEMI
MLFSKNLKLVLIDLSGTIHIENEITPNAIEALKRLRASKVSLKFVTNTTKESRRVLHERLTNLGFHIELEEIWSSLWAARDKIVADSLKPMLLVDEAALEDFSGLSKFEGEPNAVVVGLAPKHFQYDILNRAFRLLLNGAKLIAIHEGRYYKTSSGLSLGPGPFVKGLEYSANCKAHIVGKPSPEFFRASLGDIDPSSTIMIGDVS